MTEKAASPTPEALEGEISVATDTPTEPVTEPAEKEDATAEVTTEATAEPETVEAPVEAESPPAIEAPPADEAPTEAERTPAPEEVAAEVVAKATEEPAAVEEATAVAEEAPAATEEAPAVAEEAPAAVEEAPAVAEKAPAATEEAPVVAKEAPAAAEETAPVAEAEAPAKSGDGAGSGEIAALRDAKESQTAVEGKVIGWNNGGFHVVIGELTAFCPRSEMEIGSPKAPRNYVDKTFQFQVLKVQKKGRRVVLSRASLLRGERSKQREEIRGRLSPGSVVTGQVASLTDFGAFVELGGVQGLVHVSEISRNRINSPSDVLQVGQEVTVKVLKLEKGGRRISLSMRALEPDPWREVKEKFPEGSTQIGKVEKAETFGAFIELEPGLTGLLPLSAMSIPRDTSPARVYPPGREVKVIVMSVDSRRRRISLALEGSTLEGTRNDYKSYQKEQTSGTGGSGGFNALAEAFKRLDGD